MNEGGTEKPHLSSPPLTEHEDELPHLQRRQRTIEFYLISAQSPTQGWKIVRGSRGILVAKALRVGTSLPRSVLSSTHPTYQANRLLLRSPRLPGYQGALWLCSPLPLSLI